jgi:hypothetical protein
VKKGKMFRCNDPKHEGDSWLPLNEKGHGRKCKSCKAADSRRRTAERAAEKKLARKARFDSAESWEAFNRNEFLRKDRKHRYVVPVREEFESVEAFDDAWRLHERRQKDGGEGRMSVREYMDRDNARRREAYVKAPVKEPEGPQRCSHCHHMKPLEDFRPSAVEKETKKRVEFDRMFEKIVASNAARETHPILFEQWDGCRTSTCKKCREIDKRVNDNEDTAAGKCRAFWYELRQAPCVDCGRADGYSEYDHQAERGEKVHNVSHWEWWKCHGGVEAMRAEAVKCDPRCRNCHQMQPSHNIYKRKYASLDEMPTDTMDQKRAKFGRQYMDDKLCFVNVRKLSIGACAECEISVTPESCHAFAFAHVDASTKVASVSTLCNSRASLPSTMCALDEEMSKCRLLCSVCHSKETRYRNSIRHRTP